IAIVAPGTDRPASMPKIEAPLPGPVQLLAVASVTPRKGHLMLVEALAPLGALDWRLVCIGSLERDPSAAAALRAAIIRRRLAAGACAAGAALPDWATALRRWGAAFDWLVG